MPRRNKTAAERLQVYPPEMMEILAAAAKHQDWSKQFPTHAQACSFIGRFYNFRFDAIEERMQGALELREMYVTGTDASGEIFHTRRKYAPGPFTIHWKFTGLPAISQEEVRKMIEREEAPKHDTAEELISSWLKPPVGKVVKLHDTEGHDTPAVGSKGSCAEGVHEWDKMETRCLRCNKPHPDMEKAAE